LDLSPFEAHHRNESWALGVPLRVVVSLSNHTAGSKKGVTRIYQRHEYAKEKRAAVDRWAG
jgi:hypothetical protein